MWFLTTGISWHTAETVWPDSSWHETSSESNISTSFSPWFGSWSHRRVSYLGLLMYLLHSSDFGINLTFTFSLSLHPPTVYSLCATLSFGCRPASPTSPLLEHYWAGDTNGCSFVGGRGISKSYFGGKFDWFLKTSRSTWNTLFRYFQMLGICQCC